MWIRVYGVRISVCIGVRHTSFLCRKFTSPIIACSPGIFILAFLLSWRWFNGCFCWYICVVPLSFCLVFVPFGLFGRVFFSRVLLLILNFMRWSYQFRMKINFFNVKSKRNQTTQMSSPCSNMYPGLLFKERYKRKK